MHISTEQRDAFLVALQEELDTRDKRYMFLRMEFREIISYINIEGSPRTTAWNIYSEFEKQGMLGSLMATMNCKFDLNLLKLNCFIESAFSCILHQFEKFLSSIIFLTSTFSSNFFF